MDGIMQCQTEVRRLRGIIRENEAGYADVLQALGREYDKALEQEPTGDPLRGSLPGAVGPPHRTHRGNHENRKNIGRKI